MLNRATILIVDDDVSIRESLQRLLQLNGYAVETFNSAVSMLAYRLPSGPCCAIIDVKMPGRTGLDLQRSLAQTRPGLPVIFITGYAVIPEAVQAIKAGAADFLTKPIEERRLLDAIKRALLLEQRARHEQEQVNLYLAQFDTLTAREQEVCGLVVAGKLNKQIAADLGTCEKTVKVHRGRVMKKMKVESVAELVRAYVKIATKRRDPQPTAPSAAAERSSLHGPPPRLRDHPAR